MAAGDVTGVVGLLVFAVLGGGLVALWRWADRVNRAHGPPGRSEDIDPYRNIGL